MDGFTLLFVVLWLTASVGYVMNLVALFQGSDLWLVRAVGVIILPLGAVLGWLPL